MYKNALVAKQQLEEVGLAVDLQVVDWATLNHRTEKPELWEVSPRPSRSPRPRQSHGLSLHVPGLVVHEEKERLLGELQVEMDPKKRKAIVDRLQTVFYEEVGSVKLGSSSRSTSRAATCAGSSAPRRDCTSGIAGSRSSAPVPERNSVAGSIAVPAAPAAAVCGAGGVMAWERGRGGR